MARPLSDTQSLCADSDSETGLRWVSGPPRTEVVKISVARPQRKLEHLVHV